MTGSSHLRQSCRVILYDQQRLLLVLHKVVEEAGMFKQAREKIKVSYSETVHTIFENAARLGPADSVVLATVQTLKLRHSKNKNGKVL